MDADLGLWRGRRTLVGRTSSGVSKNDRSLGGALDVLRPIHAWAGETASKCRGGVVRASRAVRAFSPRRAGEVCRCRGRRCERGQAAPHAGEALCGHPHVVSNPCCFTRPSTPMLLVCSYCNVSTSVSHGILHRSRMGACGESYPGADTGVRLRRELTHNGPVEPISPMARERNLSQPIERRCFVSWCRHRDLPEDSIKPVQE